MRFGVRRSVLLLFAGVAACTQRDHRAGIETDTALALYVAAQADSGAAAWNRGDLRAFLAPYADSVVIVYPDGPLVGRDRLEAVQRANAAWNGARPPEQAAIGKSRLRRIGPGDALQTVEIILRRPGGGERRLWSTVLWTRTSAGWRVVHEQSF